MNDVRITIVSELAQGATFRLPKDGQHIAWTRGCTMGQGLVECLREGSIWNKAKFRTDKVVIEVND